MYGAYSVLCERDMMQREVDVAPLVMACTLYMTMGFCISIQAEACV